MSVTRRRNLAILFTILAIVSGVIGYLCGQGVNGVLEEGVTGSNPGLALGTAALAMASGFFLYCAAPILGLVALVCGLSALFAYKLDGSQS